MKNNISNENKNFFKRFWEHYIMSMVLSGIYSISLFLLVHTIFFTIEQIHYKWCAPLSAYGFITSMLTSNSGMCRQLRNISMAASNASSNMVYLFGCGIAGWIIQKNTKT